MPADRLLSPTHRYAPLRQRLQALMEGLEKASVTCLTSRLLPCCAAPP